MQMVQLFVVTFSGRNIIIQVPKHAKIGLIRSIISEREGIPTNQIKLLYGTRYLDDSHDIDYYSITENSTIYQL